MISVRAGTGWQTTLADLAIILFLVTAAALSQSEAAPAPAAPQAVEPSPQSQPLALYRAEAGAPPLREWLDAQSPDVRQQLTIVAQFAPGRQADALAKAEALAQEAGETGTRARIVIEPGTGGTIASLAYDDPKSTMARPLQEAARHE